MRDAIDSAGRLLLVTGGARAGKSRWAERTAAALGAPVTMLATAEALDEEMRARIAVHRAERPTAWRTVEEPQHVAAAIRGVPADETLILDCLTLWTSNRLFAGADDATILSEADSIAAAATARTGVTIVVTNEVGLGLVPDNALGRRYRDLLGGVNQRVAAAAAEVVLLVSGRALVLPAAPSPSAPAPRSACT